MKGNLLISDGYEYKSSSSSFSSSSSSSSLANAPYNLTSALFRMTAYVRGLSGKYPAILNISRTGRMALM